MTPNLPEASAKLRSAVTAAARGLVDREPLVELVALSAVAREHLLVIGPAREWMFNLAGLLRGVMLRSAALRQPLMAPRGTWPAAKTCMQSTPHRSDSTLCGEYQIWVIS